MGLWALFLVMASSTRMEPRGDFTAQCPARSSRRRGSNTFKYSTDMQTTQSVRYEDGLGREFP